MSRSALLLREVQRFGRQAAVAKLRMAGTLVPQGTEAVIDDEQVEIRARAFEDALERVVRHRRIGNEQRGPVIVKTSHGVILSDA